jgi:hypothetical protein
MAGWDLSFVILFPKVLHMFQIMERMLGCHDACIVGECFHAISRSVNTIC